MPKVIVTDNGQEYFYTLSYVQYDMLKRHKRADVKVKAIHEMYLWVDADEVQEYERFCKEPPGDCGRGEVIFDEEVVFPDGNRVAIQVVADEEPNERECWTQGVLFGAEGTELGCTDVGDFFLGNHCLNYNDDEYVVIVKESAVKSQVERRQSSELSETE
jgi:hypothetical protein